MSANCFAFCGFGGDPTAFEEVFTHNDIGESQSALITPGRLIIIEVKCFCDAV
jgi:hypothetical protein